MKSEKNTYYLVHTSAMPEVLEKTVQVNEMLSRGEVRTIYEAVDKVGISRSAYYKYRNHVFPFYEMGKGRIVTISLVMDHVAGCLMAVLREIARVKGSIVTINQNIPYLQVANATVSIETRDLNVHVEELINNLKVIDGVREVKIMGNE
ncbi:MAG: ACT domain-containing protein [Tindallia sp. MSAO_Bac2]|nr:MAG: ACT domain-containing protein [Tindallia sp. MSAO_Bac2]